MVEHGGRVVQWGRRKKEVSRRTGGSPGRPWRRRRPAGRDDGDESMLVAAAGSGRERVGGGDWGPPGTIPSAWRSSTARRSLWQSWLGSGRPTATARCAAAMAASRLWEEQREELGFPEGKVQWEREEERAPPLPRSRDGHGGHGDSAIAVATVTMSLFQKTPWFTFPSSVFIIFFK